jgi:hypothetical protein
MHAQASRTTQKIRQPIDMEAIASIEDPTLRFFLEGEAMEKAARRAEAEGAPSERGQGFAGRFGNDNSATLRILDSQQDEPPVKPRGHGGAIAFAALSSMTAIGVAAWMWMTPPVRPALWWLTGSAPAAAVVETTEAMPRTTEAPVKAEANSETALPAAAPAVVAPMAADTTATPTGAAAETAPRAPGGPIIEQIPSPPVAAVAAAAPRVPAERRAGRGEALHGYVWSPAAKAMVPTGTSATDSPAAVDNEPGRPVPANATPPASDGVMVPSSLSGAGIAPASTGPAPDEGARIPTTEPGPFETSAQAPAKTSAPIID